MYLSLRNEVRSNNSNIFITDIGAGDDEALLCFTDLTRCCRSFQANGIPLGEWFYPNGSVIDVSDSGNNFYRNRGQSVVRLNQRNNAVSPTGLFCCEVPDALPVNITVCANIG